MVMDRDHTSKLLLAWEKTYGGLSPAQEALERATSEAFLSRLEIIRKAGPSRPLNPAGVLDRKLRSLADRLKGHELRIAACYAIANELGQVFGWPADDLAIIRILRAAELYGSFAVEHAAYEMLREGFDRSVRNPWSVLSARAAQIADLDRFRKVDESLQKQSIAVLKSDD